MFNDKDDAVFVLRRLADYSFNKEMNSFYCGIERTYNSEFPDGYIVAVWFDSERTSHCPYSGEELFNKAMTYIHG